MRLSVFNSFLATVIAVIFGFACTENQASAENREPAPNVIQVAIHLTAADGVITIGELIERGGAHPPFPPLPIASLHFLVRAGGSPLELPGIPGFHPPGYKLTIPSGSEVKFRTTHVPLTAQDAFNFFPVRTDGTTDAFLIAELYDSLTQPPLCLSIGTEALHITANDGTKSLRQLIEEQSLGTPFGNRPLSNIHFIVDSAGSALTFTQLGENTPPGFEYTINPGQSKKLDVPVTSTPVMETLESYKVRSAGAASNVLIIVELPNTIPKCQP